ncbi:hypothetical protein BE08_29900, partial [Sorangium cellulosum]
MASAAKRSAESGRRRGSRVSSWVRHQAATSSSAWSELSSPEQQRVERALEPGDRPGGEVAARRGQERDEGGARERADAEEPARRVNGEGDGRGAAGDAEELGGEDHVGAGEARRQEQEDPEQVGVPLDALAGVVGEAVARREVLQVAERDVRVVDGVAEEERAVAPRLARVEGDRGGDHGDEGDPGTRGRRCAV